MSGLGDKCNLADEITQAYHKSGGERILADGEQLRCGDNAAWPTWTTRDICEADPGDDEGWEDRRWVSVSALDELEREIATLVRERDEAVQAAAAEREESSRWFKRASDLDRDLAVERERARTVRDALVIYDIWADAMPDAGFTDSDPRWNWWHKRPYEKAREALAATADPSTATGHRE